MIWEKFYVETQGGQVTPVAPFLGAPVVICLEPGADLHMPDATATHCLSGGHTGGASGAVHQGPRPLGAHQRGPDSNFLKN